MDDDPQSVEDFDAMIPSTAEPPESNLQELCKAEVIQLTIGAGTAIRTKHFLELCGDRQSMWRNHQKPGGNHMTDL